MRRLRLNDGLTNAPPGRLVPAPSPSISFRSAPLTCARPMVPATLTLPGRSSVAYRCPSSWNGRMIDVTSTVTPVTRPIGVRPYASLTAPAASPSTPLSTAKAIVPSIPVNTCVFGIACSFLLEVHRDADEVDRERRLQGHRHDRDAANLLRPSRADLELVADEHLVEDHLREEAVERRPQRRPDPGVVQPADVRVGAGPNAGLREVDDPPDRDLPERSGLGGDRPDDLEAELLPHEQDAGLQQAL